MTAHSVEPTTQGRRVSVRIAAVLGLLLFGFYFGVVAAETMDMIQAGAEGSPSDPAPSPEARLGAVHPGEVVHGAGAISILAIGGGGLLALIVSPERSGYAYLVLAAMAGMLITLPIVGNPNNVGGQAGWIDPVFLVLVVPAIVAGSLALPWGRWREGASRPSLLILAAIAAAPAAWYGIDQALMQRNSFPPTADPHHNAHWWVMAIVAFMAVLVTAAAALPSLGWRLGAVLVGVASIVVGAASILDQSAASALPVLGAIGAALWGLAALWLSVRGKRTVH